MTARLCARELLGVDLETEPESFAFAGDSPNDAPMFAAFPLSFGMANVRDFLDLLTHQPAYVTDAASGAGFAEMARLIFGIDGANQGEIHVKGKKASISSPRSAMMEGMGFCSEDRKSEGIFAELTVRENIILALQAKNGILRYIPARKQLEIADELIKSLAIKTPSANSQAGQLSGGNQQKVMLARWLATNPIVLILDEPTRGIDVGAKLEIMELILNLSRQGMGVIFISSEFEEVVRCSSRIAVLRDKAKIAELSGEDVNETSIMQTIAGGN